MPPLKLSPLLRVLVLASTLTVTGCYFAIPTMVETVKQNRNLEEAEGKALESTTGAIRLLANTGENARVNWYIRGYNALMVGQWSLMPSYQVLTEKTMTADGKGAVPYPVVMGLTEAIREFRMGLLLHDEEGTELDADIQQAVDAAEKLKHDETNSLPYFRNRVYLRDDMQGARRVLPYLKGDYDRLIAVIDRIGMQLSAFQKAEATRLVAQHRADKDLVGLYTEQSLLDAQDLMTFLKEKDVYRNARAYQYADLQVAELERSLTGLKDASTKAGRPLNPTQGLGAVYTQLRELLNLYAALKQGQRDVTYNRMMRRYSDAIMLYNGLLEKKPVPISETPKGESE